MSKLYTPAKIYDEFLQRMVKKTRKLRLGDPKNQETDLGPLISKKQQERVLRYIVIGMNEGAKVTFGGTIPSDPFLAKGFFVEPTLFVDVLNKVRIAQEQIIAPVLSIIRHKTVEEAVAVANDSMWGLGDRGCSHETKKEMWMSQSGSRQVPSGS